MDVFRDLVERFKNVGVQCPVDIFGESKATPAELDEALRHVHLWTYRKDFREPLPSSSLYSDAGWGCLIRTGQMLLSRGLQLHLPEGAVDPHWFFDTPDALFSIHQFVKAVALPRHRFAPDFWSATKCCLAIQTVTHNANLGLRVCVAEAGSAYRDEVRFTLTSSSVLLLFPTRASQSQRLTQVAFHQVQHILKSPLCIGIVGGHPKRSYYFIGVSHTQSQEQRLVYLDPHIATQSAFVDDETRGTGHEAATTIQTIAWDRTDASVLVGVYLRDIADFDAFEAHGRALRCGKDSQFFLSFSDSRPSANAVADDECHFPSDGSQEDGSVLPLGSRSPMSASPPQAHTTSPSPAGPSPAYASPAHTHADDPHDIANIDIPDGIPSF